MRAGRSLPLIGRSLFFRISLLMAIKLAFLRLYIFEKVDWSGAVIDLASAIIITGFIELFVPERVKRAAFWGVNGLASIIFFAASLYYSHFGSIVTYTSLYGLKQVMQVSNSVKSHINVHDYVFFVDFLVAGVLWLFGKRRRLAGLSGVPLRKVTVTGLVAVSVMISAMSIRADGKVRNELIRAEQLGFINYQSAFAWSFWENSRETKFTDIDQAAAVIRSLQSKYSYRAPSPDSDNDPDSDASVQQAPKLFGAYKGKNLIVIQMESLQRFTIGYSVEGEPLTPVLNELVKESYYFPNVYQQIGQGNTSDAEFLFNTSLYTVGSIPMSTGYGNRELPSLPRLLREEGYRSLTLHVNDVWFWDRDKLYAALGFERYYDKPFFENDGFNAFGASDEELYRKSYNELLELGKQNTPFYAHLISSSNHHPFTIPDSKKKLRLPGGQYADTQVGEYLESVHYADYALGTFIDKLKADGLWDDSVVVVYGDHSGLKQQYNEPEQVSKVLGIPYHPYVTGFNVPFIVHVPGQTEGAVIEQVGGQMDMMPTVANMLGLSLKESGSVYFGHDLMNIDRNVFGIRYYLPTGSFVNDDILFIPGKEFEDGTALSLKTLEPVADLTPYKRDYYYTLAMMKLSDEYMKVLPKREAE